MRTLKGFLYLILGGTLCGWMFNRIAAWFIDNPLTVGSNHTVAEWAVILQDPFYLDSRTMPFFFLAYFMQVFANMLNTQLTAVKGSFSVPMIFWAIIGVIIAVVYEQLTEKSAE